MPRIIVGAEQAFLSQLLWQIRHGWTRQRSLEAWHANHPDISDDVFEQLYEKSICSKRGMDYFNQAGGLLTIKECQQWGKRK